MLQCYSIKCYIKKKLFKVNYLLSHEPCIWNKIIHSAHDLNKTAEFKTSLITKDYKSFIELKFQKDN